MEAHVIENPEELKPKNDMTDKTIFFLQSIENL